jgi:hypothetical protein
MPHPTRLTLVVALLGMLLLGAGCTTTVAGTPAADPAPPPTEGPGSDPVAWADRLCGALLTFVRPAQAVPPVEDAPDLPSIQRALSDYLGAVVTGVQDSRTQLAGIGRSPVTGGDEATIRIEGVLRRLEQDFTNAKAKVDEADPDDPDAFVATLTEVETLLNQITAPDALADLGAIPRLDRAAERAATCRELDEVSAELPG